MTGKSRKEEEDKHLKNRKEEQKLKKVMAQQVAPTKNNPKPQGGRGVPTKNRGANPPNILRKTTPNCVLCNKTHWTKQHSFQLHGNFSHQHILDTLRQHKICFRCALPFTPTHKFQNCSNPITQCEHCASFNHVSLCCKNRKNIPLDLPRVAFDPKNPKNRSDWGNQQDVIQID